MYEQESKELPFIVQLAMIFGLIALCVLPFIIVNNQRKLENVETANIDKADFYNLVNNYRTSKNLNTLNINSQLEESAKLKLDDMEARGYFGHTVNGDFEADVWANFKKAGYISNGAGENLAKGYKSASDTMRDWEASKEHNDVLLGNYKDMGLFIRCSATCSIVLHTGSQK